MSRIAEVFRALHARGEGALVPYLMAGDPDPQRSLTYLHALLEGGADVLELGVPFSDPIADGPAIQAASVRALRAGTTLETAFHLVEELRRRWQQPIVLMLYYNLVFAYGEDTFVTRCRRAGVDGLIVPDLPLEEAGPLSALAEEAGLDLVQLVTPETPPARLRRLAQASRGFLYLVSRYGVTGPTTTLDETTAARIRRAKAAAEELPLAVGFGLSRPEQVSAVLAQGADGAIVGSALVEAVGQEVPPQLLRERVRALKAATRAGRTAPSQAPPPTSG